MRRVKRKGLLSGIGEGFLAAVLFCGQGIAADSDVLASWLQRPGPREHVSGEELKKASDDGSVTALMEIVEGRRDDWKLQIAAIRLLGEIGNPVATDLLIRVVTDHFFTNECPALKWNGIIALGSFRDDPRVVDALLYRVREETVYLREAVIQSLGRIGNREALPYIIAALQEKSFAVRISAVRALGEMGYREAVPHLKKIAETDSEPLMRKEALRALERLG